MDKLYINFMPQYADAPVSLWLLKKNVDAAATAAADAVKNGTQLRLLLPSGASDTAAALTAAVASSGVSAHVVRGSNPDDEAEASAADVIVTLNDASFGFVYTNDRAAARVFTGDKPIPAHHNGEAALDGSLPPTLISGEAWLRGAGVVEGEGTYVSIVGPDGTYAKPVELAEGACGTDVVSASGIDASEVKALYLGFPTSVFVPADKLAEPLDLSRGCDVVRVYTTKNCMAAAMERISAHWHNESCGHCVFGHEGSWQIASIFEDIVNKRGLAGDLDTLRDLCPTMELNTICDVDAMLARTTLQAIELFGDEIAAHYGASKTCAAGECVAYKTYHVLVSKCVGCGDCLAACEDGAILGKAKFVHVINQLKCTQCGRCYDACDYHAVVRAGAKKPKTPPRPIPCRAKA